MAANATLVSVQEYLRLQAKPAFEYNHGTLTQKHMPTWKHSLLQLRIGQLLSAVPGLMVGSELTVRVREDRYLVPDVAVQRRANIQDPYPIEPIPLCVEVLSPDDRLSEVIGKAEEYHTWGVPMVWILDPLLPTAWEFPAGGRIHEVPQGGSLTAEGIAIPLDELFSVLD